MKTTILLLAAGSGERFGKPKRDIKLAGKTLLQWNLELLKKLPFKHQLIVVTKGGKTRHESVKIGLKKAKREIVIIHNVANPMATVQDFVRIRNTLIKKNAACFVGQKIVDTVRVLRDGRSTTIPRDHLWRVQTPQGFRRETLAAAVTTYSRNPSLEEVSEKVFFESFRRRAEDSPKAGRSVRPRFDEGRVAYPSRQKTFSETSEVTDEIMLFEGRCEKCGPKRSEGELREPERSEGRRHRNFDEISVKGEHFPSSRTKTPIFAFETSALNQKITVPKDLAMMERYLSMDVRVGIGEDSHAFDSRGTLMLGGVKISGYPKLKANSDGDVVLHALCNALRSAVGKGSFSKIADPMCRKGIRDSKKYIQKIIKQCVAVGSRINNIAISITCQKPKIDPLVPRLKKSLSMLLDLDPKRIGVTATTQEVIALYRNIPHHIKVACTVTLFQYTR